MAARRYAVLAGPDCRRQDAVLTEVTWEGADVMVWVPPAGAYSVWWFWEPVSGEFRGWYGNLEEAQVRWDDGATAGIDTVDQALDLWVHPDGTRVWKDLDEFTARTGIALYWNESEAAGIREVADRLADLAVRRTFQFDGTWTDFRPRCRLASDRPSRRLGPTTGLLTWWPASAAGGHQPISTHEASVTTEALIW